MNVCRSCKKPIIWARTPAGKAIPLDFEPVHGGSLRLFNGVVTFVPQAQRSGPLWVTHFASCQLATQHRRRAQTRRETA